MFSGIGFAEILVVMLVALLVLGPDKLPDAARKLGRGLREVRRTTNMFRDMLLLDEDLDASTPAQAAGTAAHPAPDEGAAGTMAAQVARPAGRAGRSRPVLLNAPRRATYIRQVMLAAPEEPAGPELYAYVELPAARRIKI